MALKDFFFTSESVSEGHPDKMCDQISDAILDALLAKDPQSRVACETLAKTGMVVVAGEITTNALVSYPDVVRKVVRDIGYVSSEMGFDADTCAVLIALDRQSGDIAMGVDASSKKEQGAGDQGMMFGYACDETPEKMPLPIQLAQRITARLAAARKAETVRYLRPDGKAQVTVRYSEQDGRLVPVAVERVLVSTQHHPDVHDEQRIRADVIEHVLMPVIPAQLGPHEPLAEAGCWLGNPT